MYVPTKEQWQELRTFCVWTWQEDGYRVTGNNGNSIFLPAAGWRYCDGDVVDVGSFGIYWSSTHNDSDEAWSLGLYWGGVNMGYDDPCFGKSVRLVQ